MWLESEHETKRGKKIYMEIGQDKKNKSTKKKKKKKKKKERETKSLSVVSFV